MADKEFKYLVRIASTDLDGKKSLMYALPKIKGISLMYANALCTIAGVDPNQKVGYLSDEDVTKINKAVKDPSKIPKWIMNRQKDYDTGENIHLIMSDLIFTQDNDLKRLKMIKSYRGLRHQWKLTVRGQRTKSNFRKTKTANSRKKKQMKRGRV
jgi:small subunit ribosomal protein S13